VVILTLSTALPATRALPQRNIKTREEVLSFLNNQVTGQTE
jgi:hypothetical protein